MVAAPILFVAMKGVSRHYRGWRRSWPPTAAGPTLPGADPHRGAGLQPAGPHPSGARLRETTNPATLRAVHVAADESGDDPPEDGAQRGVPTPLVVIESPFRETTRPVLRYVRQLLRENPGDVVSVVIPEYVVEHWWQNLLHNQTALRLKGRLLFEPSVTVTSVPWVLR